MNIKRYLANKKRQIDRELDKLLPKLSKRDPLIRAMRYSVFSGGKRLRPILALEAARLVSDKSKEAMTVACAIEFVHTFSLIHDDLPCMDNDDYRRGKLTCHRVFDEDVALLAGDALLNQAYVCLTESLKRGEISEEIFAKLVLEFSKNIGKNGLIGGQMNDLLLNPVREKFSNGINLKNLEKIYLQKTAALFILAVRAGAIVSSSDRKYLASLSGFAKNFGLAFQIIDDCLDSGIGEINYLNLMRPRTARAKAKKYITQAKEYLKVFGRKAEHLKQLADFVAERKF